MLKSTFTSLLFLLPIFLHCQVDFLPIKINDIDYLHIKDSLAEHCAINKKIPENIIMQTLLALSHYPELKKVAVNFKYKKIKTTMASRPNLFSIFRKKSKRKYTIYINNEQKNKKNICIENLSFNAEVGVLSHELAHIYDYQNKTGLQIMGVAFKYSSKKWRAKFEKTIDSIAISRGFGWQVYDFCNYIQTSSEVPEKYKSYKRKVYYTPDDILLIIKDLEIKK